MAYQFTQFPLLCWSFSKVRLMEECLRKYYYNTYGGHNGWLENAIPVVRKLYLLKKLKPINSFYGELFHNAVKYLLEGTFSVNNPAFLRSYIKNQIQSNYKQSIERKADWELNPKAFSMIAEVYHYSDIPQNQKESINKKTRLCSENLFLNNIFIEAIAGHYEILELDELQQFPFGDDGITCYLKIDALFKHKSGRHIVVDWKTSISPSTDDVKQLLAYAYYVVTKYNVPIEKVEARSEYIAQNKTQVYQFTNQDLERFTEQLEVEIQRIKDFIVPGTVNQPLDSEFFRKTSNKDICVGCNFKEICKGKTSNNNAMTNFYAMQRGC